MVSDKTPFQGFRIVKSKSYDMRKNKKQIIRYEETIKSKSYDMKKTKANHTICLFCIKH